jgi:hypothetical protein
MWLRKVTEVTMGGAGSHPSARCACSGQAPSARCTALRAGSCSDERPLLQTVKMGGQRQLSKQ